jgi:tetratricopeptide (TPR) repeat protein
MKRLICLRKAAGDLAGATKELTTYLKTFASDEHAWLELVDLYVQTGKLELAKFASEELLLMMPESFLYHLQYAEIVYSLGGKTNHTLARQYYAQSLELKPDNNLRALYGLMLCLSATASNALSPEMHTFSADKITALYRKVVSEEASAKYETTISKEGAQTGQLSDQSPNLRFEASSSARNPNPYLPFLVSESLKV